MSDNSHREKYFSKLLIGFAAVTGSIFLILYAAFERTKEGDWYFWGIVASFLMCAGFYFLLSAFVHKIKSDFSRRQKTRDQQKTFTAD
jgi:FtsH-binding integral membrane protein